METKQHIIRIEKNISIYENYLDEHPQDKEATKKLNILRLVRQKLLELLNK
jgi:ribosomal protein S15P/S13E